MGPEFAPVSKNIQYSNVSIHVGDMTRLEADAFIIPEFQGGASYGGVGGAVMRAGGSDGLKAYNSIATAQNGLGFGSVVLTHSGGGNAKKLLHTVTVGSGADQEFEVVQQAIYLSCKTAEKNRITSIAAPALGTGIIGALTAEQSAKAMISGIDNFAQEGGVVDFKIVIYGDAEAAAQFGKVLTDESYKGATSELGSKKLDVARWVHEMEEDSFANAKFD